MSDPNNDPNRMNNPDFTEAQEVSSCVAKAIGAGEVAVWALTIAEWTKDNKIASGIAFSVGQLAVGVGAYFGVKKVNKLRFEAENIEYLRQLDSRENITRRNMVLIPHITDEN